MPLKYTAGELRAWHRGYRMYRLGKSYDACKSQNADRVAALRAGWFSAAEEDKELDSRLKQAGMTGQYDEKENCNQEIAV